MRLIRGGNKKINIIIKLSVFGLCAYGIVTLVNQQIQISQKKAELDTLDEQIITQQKQNDEIRHIVEASKEENQTYIERVARESLDFAKQGERVFINISGN